jgi:hypothetical protein
MCLLFRQLQIDLKIELSHLEELALWFWIYLILKKIKHIYYRYFQAVTVSLLPSNNVYCTG